MKRSLCALTACLVLALAAGCGDDDDSSGEAGGGGGYGSSAATQQDTGKTEAAAGGLTVHMKDIAFDPKTIKAKVGDTVKWVNDDTVDHNVVGDDFESKTFGQGGTYEYKVDEAGTIKYECTLHPGMEGTIEATK